MPNTCISLTYSNSLRNTFYLSVTEQVFIYVLTPIIYFASIFNIVFFLKGKNRAQPPADILLFLCVFGILRMTSYFISAIYDDIYQPSQGAEVPSSYHDLCLGTGFIIVLCEMASFVYNVVFCIYYVIKIKNPLKSWIKQHRQIHIFCIIVIVGLTLVFFLTDLIGVSILGICGYRIGGGIIYLDIVLTISYFLVMIISSIFFIKYLKSISKFDNDNKMYFKFYFKYLIIVSILHLTGLISLFIATIKCLLDSSDFTFKFFTIVCNISRLLTPFVVFMVMVNHPQAKLSSVLQFVNKICSCCFSQHQPQIKQQEQSFYSELMTTKRTSMVIQLRQLNKSDFQTADFLSKIKDRNKACLINTILGCISLQQNQYLEILESRKSILIIDKSSIRIQDLRLSTLNFDDDQIFGWNYKQKYQFQLTDDIVLAYKQIFNQKLPTINLKFISFSSSVFKKLQKQQKINDLDKKMLPTRNQTNILQNVQTDGGRSGQFFFFNYDSSIIIKTITSSQLQVLLQRIEPYYDYFQRNPSSLIVKILGLYKVLNIQTSQQISFMLMGNILRNISKKYVIRSYDMKGSSHQRQVLKTQELRQQGQIQTNKTLKDIDFHTLQGQVNISKFDSKNLKKIIEQDTLFLYSQGLIDYSLILLKIDYKRLCQQTDFIIDDVKMYKSTKQPGIVYVFGIIDYLQTWNIRKKGEKWYKSLFSKTDRISSQDPRFYAQRFMKSLIMMILP